MLGSDDGTCCEVSTRNRLNIYILCASFAVVTASNDLVFTVNVRTLLLGRDCIVLEYISG